MEKKLNTGLIGKATVIVDETNTAKTVGSGSLDVFATPAMMALMEKAACASIKDELDEGSTTVGIHLDVTHDAPTPIGMQVSCEAYLEEVEGRKLMFRVEARDEVGVIGKGKHERFIVPAEGFQDKANQRKG